MAANVPSPPRCPDPVRDRGEPGPLDGSLDREISGGLADAASLKPLSAASAHIANARARSTCSPSRS